MKEQIRQLINNEQIKEALDLLIPVNREALLMQAQYNIGEKHYNLGLIDIDEWQRIRLKIKSKIKSIM